MPKHKPAPLGGQFAWGSLVFWMRQTIADPAASLRAKNYGTVSLPGVAPSCFELKCVCVDGATAGSFIACFKYSRMCGPT